MTKEYDLVVLGGGTGGYVAAIRASQLGMKVAIVESNELGGTCLHQGCIPSKALLKTAEMYRQLKHVDDYGISLSNYAVDFTKAQERKNNVVQQLHEGVKLLLKKAKVTVYHGFGRILGPSIFSPMPGTISVEHTDGTENTMLIPKNVLIATGSKPRAIKDLPFDGEHVLNSDHALQMEQLPNSIIIIGGGVIGIEWASMLQDLGVQVTVIENSKDILMGEDDDVRREVKKSLTKRGVQFLTSASIDTSSFQVHEQNVSIQVKHNGEVKQLQAEKLLVSVGRKANIEQIGLQNTTIEINNDVIVTNDMYQTKETHIYAIGDCIGGMQLAHVASAEGIVAVEHMAGQRPQPINPLQIPTCIYSYPEVGRVGMTEKVAIEKGFQVKIGSFPFQANGKALINGNAHGFVKIITDEKTDDILGVHMVGPHVTDMISEGSFAKMLDASAWEMSKTIRPHPSLSEVFTESALAVNGIQIHS